MEKYAKKTATNGLRASGRSVRSGMLWRSEQTFRLIEMYQSMPCLWDGTSEAYKDRKIKNDARQAMANELGVNVYEVEKKLHSLKSQFRREHKKMRLARKTGRAIKDCAWFGYEPLMFLLQADGSSSSWSTDDQNRKGVKLEADNDCPINDYDDDDDDDIELAGEETEEGPGYLTQDGRIPASCVPNSFYKRKEVTNGRIDEAYNVMETVMTHASKRDEYSVYGEHVGNKLRNCGRKRHDIAVAQHKIDDILFRLEMGTFSKRSYQKNELDSPTPSPVNDPSPLSHIEFLPVESVLGDPGCGDPPAVD